MITNRGVPEEISYMMLRSLNLSKEYFYSLPYEIQKAIIMTCINNIKTTDEYRKKMALKQYNFEEKTKGKVLTLLKKKR